LEILPKLAIAAFVILLAILFLMCSSWLEPFIFLISIAVAILINMGTNAVFESVSDITHAIAAILQLCLSMDYSIMLLNRYKLEKQNAGSKTEAMKAALLKAFASISSSSVTTIVGMLALLFMSFTIGRDMGLVLAKGILFSLICVFTVLPALILIFDDSIRKTAKKPLHIKMDRVALFSFRANRWITGFFMLLFAFSFFLRGNVNISYTMSDYYDVNQIFTSDNTIVVLYENTEEEKIKALSDRIGENESVENISAFATTAGKEMTYDEMSAAIDMDAALTAQIYNYYFGQEDTSEQRIALYNFLRFITDNLAKDDQFKPYFTDEVLIRLEQVRTEMDDALKQLVGERYSRMIIDISLPEESDMTFGFLENLNQKLKTAFDSEYYITGSSAIAYEMSRTFPQEMNLITVLTAIAIFLVVTVSFRSFSIPLILVSLIQCSVFITMGASNLQSGGVSINYLPLLIVNCLLMGATVDYGIMYASYYRDARLVSDRKTAVVTAMNNAIHTIFTSALILITIAGFLGIIFMSSDRGISDILLFIARGGIFSAVLVVFILPGLMLSFDRFVCGKNRKKE
jgi:predicted RND superfamily exporter protein